MVMRFRGGGVGHKTSRHASDKFLSDRDPLDSRGRRGKGSEAETDTSSDPGGVIPEDDGTNGDTVGEEGEDQRREDEELDYGYAGLQIHDDEDDASKGDNDENEDDDALGAEDGEGCEDEIGLLGFANL